MDETRTKDPSLLLDSIFVAAGGALGTLLRYIINVTTFTPAFPVGTVIENITGAFLLGVTVGFIASLNKAPQWLKTGVGVGFCGGYTTMSTFAADTFVTAVHQTPLLAAVYVGISLLFGMAMAWAGIDIGKRVGLRYERRQ